MAVIVAAILGCMTQLLRVPAVVECDNHAVGCFDHAMPAALELWRDLDPSDRAVRIQIGEYAHPDAIDMGRAIKPLTEK